MSLTLIAALTWPDRVIGKDNAIPWRLGADLKRFKALTLGHPVLMGRKTWDSLPFKLPGRTNIVLSRQPREALGSAKAGFPDAVGSSLDAGLALAAAAPGGESIFIIGGAHLYAEALPKADHLALTLIHHPFAGDVFFPALDSKDWIETFRQHAVHDDGPLLSFDYEFIDLKRP